MSVLDKNTQAAKVFWKAVQTWAAGVRQWDEAIYYDIKPDEQWDVTLVSQRVYGRRCEYLAVMASAGISYVDSPINQKQIILPSEVQLRKLKFASGFESRHEYRSKGQPTWRVD